MPKTLEGSAILGIRADPVGFWEKLGFHCWSKQREIIESVRDNRRTAVRSSNGVGKTAIAARTILWYLAAYPQSIVVSTATQWLQVEQTLWREIARAHATAPEFFGGKLFKTELTLAPDWFAIGLSTKEAERFGGFHSKRLLLVVDEASGVEEKIFEAGEGFLTGADSRILIIGNPLQLAGQFHRAFHKEASSWNRIHISTFDTPAFTGEEVPEAVLRSLPSKEWPQERAKMWGAESSLYAARVLGEFPTRSDDAVCFLGDVEAAQVRELEPGLPLVISCDVAGYGDDETVIAVREGDRVGIAAVLTGKDSVEVAGHVAMVARSELERTGAAHAHVVIDEAGIGFGVKSILQQDNRFHVHGFNAARSAKHPDRYPLQRDEMWFNFSDLLREGKIDLDSDPRLLEDLVAPIYSFDLKQRRKVEKKDETKKRLGRSPDRADAVLMAFAFNPNEQAQVEEVQPQDRRAFSAGVMTRQF